VIAIEAPAPVEVATMLAELRGELESDQPDGAVAAVPPQELGNLLTEARQKARTASATETLEPRQLQ